MFGGDTSAASDSVRGKDNPWPNYLASPACVFLNLLFDLDVDKPLARTGEVLTYTLTGKNLSHQHPEPGQRAAEVRRQRRVLRGRLRQRRSRRCARAGRQLRRRRQELPGLAQRQSGPLGRIQADRPLHRGRRRPRHQRDVRQLPLDPAASAGLHHPVADRHPRGGGGQGDAGRPISSTAAGGVASLVRHVVQSGHRRGLAVVADAWCCPAGWTVSGPLVLGGATLTCNSGCGGNRPAYSTGASLARRRQPGAHVLRRGAGRRRAGPVRRRPAGLGLAEHVRRRLRDLLPARRPGAGGRLALRPARACAARSAPAPPGSRAPPASPTAPPCASTSTACRAGTATASGGRWTLTDLSGFGTLYGGLEVRATATGPGELESELSAPCFVSVTPACSDGRDNDSDGATDFPADPGCSRRSTASEGDDARPVQRRLGQRRRRPRSTSRPTRLRRPPTTDRERRRRPARDGLDNDGDGPIDFPADSAAAAPATPPSW